MRAGGMFTSAAVLFLHFRPRTQTPSSSAEPTRIASRHSQTRPPRPTMSSSPSDAPTSPAPAFAPAFAAGYMDDHDEQFGFALSLDSPVFSNDLEYEDAAAHENDEEEEDKAALMRSVPERDIAPGVVFAPMMMRSDAFLETNMYESSTDKAPVFVLDQAPLPSPSFGACDHEFFATIPKSKVPTFAASPVSPAAFVDAVQVPQKERSDFFYSVNPTFTSSESPSKIMDVVKTALASLRCEYTVKKQWTLEVNCLVVAEEITFSVFLSQLRGTHAKYEVEFVRRSGDDLVFVDLAEHIRAQCGDVDDEGALALFSKLLDPWMDEKVQLTGRRYAIKESEAANLLDELNCEYVHPESLYEVAKNIKNHCRHKGNRKLFVQQQDHHKGLLKGLQWMLSDNEALARFALFVLQQYAEDEELCSSFFTTAFEKSSFLLLVDDLLARETKLSRGSGSKFTSEMADVVRRSALFA